MVRVVGVLGVVTGVVSLVGAIAHVYPFRRHYTISIVLYSILQNVYQM